jgi:hypothetical protein
MMDFTVRGASSSITITSRRDICKDGRAQTHTHMHACTAQESPRRAIPQTGVRGRCLQLLGWRHASTTDSADAQTTQSGRNQEPLHISLEKLQRLLSPAEYLITRGCSSAERTVCGSHELVQPPTSASTRVEVQRHTRQAGVTATRWQWRSQTTQPASYDGGGAAARAAEGATAAVRTLLMCKTTTILPPALINPPL